MIGAEKLPLHPVCKPGLLNLVPVSHFAEKVVKTNKTDVIGLGFLFIFYFILGNVSNFMRPVTHHLLTIILSFTKVPTFWD